MSFDERKKRFTDLLIKRHSLPGIRSLTQSYGVSNGPRVIEGGLQLCVANLDGFAAGRRPQFVVGAQIRFPPSDEVWFAVTVGRADVPALAARLADMKAGGASATGAAWEATGEGGEAAAPGDLFHGGVEPPEDLAASAAPEAVPAGTALPAYAGRNNLTRIYITPQGLHLHNSAFFDSLIEAPPGALGPAIPVEEVVYSVWPPSPRTRRSLITQEFIGYLADLVGRSRVHEVHAWPEESALSPAMRRMPATVPIGEIVRSIEAMGGYYRNGEIEQLHAALNFLPDKHFVVLSGPSGTGKTKIARCYANAVHGFDREDAEDPLLFVVPVRPDWTDPSALTGYPDVLTGRYMVPPFLEALRKAEENTSAPVFVILDEMNLSRVEYYFADVLSAIESRARLQLHSSDTPMEGSNGMSVPRETGVPRNLFILGTINIDETTNALSDKVLDRTMLVRIGSMDPRAFLDALTVREPGLALSIAACRELIGDVHGIMAAAGQAFGNRVAEEAVRYHAFASSVLGMSDNEILDRVLRQKVLVKLRGADRELGMLEGLTKRVKDLHESSALLSGLVDELSELGSFQASR